MDNTKGVLRVIINSQSVMKAEILAEVKKVGNGVKEHRRETKVEFKKAAQRMDRLGKSLAFLECDVPSRTIQYLRS